MLAAQRALISFVKAISAMLLFKIDELIRSRSEKYNLASILNALLDNNNTAELLPKG